MWSSPHPWGCFQGTPAVPAHGHVFPTPVGVFLSEMRDKVMKIRLPHTRGGVSPWRQDAGHARRSSPHPWGCFYPATTLNPSSTVFPTPVGVFPLADTEHRGGPSLPHTRGGVSPAPGPRPADATSSPHPWGCFHLRPNGGLQPRVFPTPVGVFLNFGISDYYVESLPHTRGGVSEDGLRPVRPAESSPHPWGCFHLWHGPHRRAVVFPTPVGVFPATTAMRISPRRLPHTRGGVSTRPSPSTPRLPSSPHPWGCFFPAS